MGIKVASSSWALSLPCEIPVKATVTKPAKKSKVVAPSSSSSEILTVEDKLRADVLGNISDAFLALSSAHAQLAPKLVKQFVQLGLKEPLASMLSTNSSFKKLSSVSSPSGDLDTEN